MSCSVPMEVTIALLLLGGLLIRSVSHFKAKVNKKFLNAFNNLQKIINLYPEAIGIPN